MNLFQLEYFITLAETLNYTKASQKLHITQPNLSKSIVNLERSVGSQLFRRNKRDVSLTPAGEVFYKEVKKTISSYETAIEKTRDAERGNSGVISIGFLGTAMVRRLPQIMNRFYHSYSKISVILNDYTYSPLMEALAEDQIDLAILPDQELHNIPGLEKKPLFTDDMCIAVHRSHRLADRASVHVSELKDEPFINMSPKVSIRDYNLVNNICLDHEFLPNTVYEANTLLNITMMIECQVGVAILARHMCHFATDNIRFIPLEGYENYFKIVCAWRRDKNPSLPVLLQTIDEVLAK